MSENAECVLITSDGAAGFATGVSRVTGDKVEIRKLRYCPYCKRDVDSVACLLESSVRQTCGICGNILGEARVFAAGDGSAAGRKVRVEVV